MTLREIQEQQRPWVKHNFGDRPAYWPLLGAMEELGELAHAHLKEEQGIRQAEPLIQKAQDAVADVVIFLCDYCSARGWDIEGLVDIAWADVRQRDWKADPELGESGTGKE